MVLVDDEPVGAQAVEADDSALTRSVLTGSWIVRRAHGRGIGREMRQAILHFAFVVLGAVEARSAALVDNPASRRVSESCERGVR